MNNSTEVGAWDFLILGVDDRFTAFRRSHLKSLTALGIGEHRNCRRLVIRVFNESREYAQINDTQLFRPVEGTALRQ